MGTIADETEEYPHRFDVKKLVCYGCANSASGKEYPSHPSGEYACCYCVRNEELRKTGLPLQVHMDERCLIARGQTNVNLQCQCEPKLYLNPSGKPKSIQDGAKLRDNYKALDWLEDQRARENLMRTELKAQAESMLVDLAKWLTERFGKGVVDSLIANDSIQKLKSD